MSTNSAANRVEVLIGQANELIKHDNLQQASERLREASHLKPEDARLKAAWTRLREREGRVPVLELLRSFSTTSSEENGKKALQALQHTQLAPDDATRAVDIVLDLDTASDSLDLVTATLLNRNLAVRRILAKRFHDDLVFDQLWERGDQSFSAFTSIPLDGASWDSPDAQAIAQKDVFKLCVSKILKAGLGHQERALKAIARQLATAPSNVKGLLDEDVFDTTLNTLDIRNDVSLRSQAMLATSKLLEIAGEEGETRFATFITTRIARQHINDLIIAFSAAAAAFPLVPGAAARLFLTEGFLEQLMTVLERQDSQRLEQAALELMSAACVDKACREAVQKHGSLWLKSVTGPHIALATLILSKINNSEGDLSTQLTELAMSAAEEEESGQAIEGLAYSSLQPKVKEAIASNPALLSKLVAQVKTKGTAAYGALTIFVNLTIYKLVVSDEQKKMSQLKAYANASKPETAEDPIEDDKHVTMRCKKVLDVGLVTALVATFKTASSAANNLTAQILLSLAKEQKHRATMAQQGAVKLLLQLRTKLTSKDTSPDPTSTDISQQAAHALARILISVNPAHVFTSGLPAPTAVPPLILLLKPEESDSQLNLLPTFEALLALTNLASLDDSTTTALIIRHVWPNLDDLLLGSNTLIQRACTELVCNLMANPACVAKYADGSAQAKNRMHVILALADVEDLATRRAAGGALAVLTEWDRAVEAVLGMQRGVEIVLGLCEDEDDGLRHRGVVCLLNVMSAPGETGERGVAKVKEEDGVVILKDMLRKTRDTTILSIGIEALKKLV